MKSFKNYTLDGKCLSSQTKFDIKTYTVDGLLKAANHFSPV